MTEKRLELVRGLGAWASAAIVVGTMLGTGISRTRKSGRMRSVRSPGAKSGECCANT